MKKILILVMAFALVALAGCKENETEVTPENEFERKLTITVGLVEANVASLKFKVNEKDFNVGDSVQAKDLEAMSIQNNFGYIVTHYRGNYSLRSFETTKSFEGSSFNLFIKMREFETTIKIKPLEQKEYIVKYEKF